MKKTLAIILAAASLAVCAPAFSGCGGGVKFTLSEDGTHYTVSFSGLSSAKGEYEIPETYGNDIPVTEIAAEGFASTGFSKIIIPGTVTKIGVAAFSYCRALKEVEFAQSIRLEQFSQGIFGHCTSLQQIKIPESVTSIGAYSFSGCSALSSVEMSAVVSIGDGAFENCTALEEITLPSTLVTIGEEAFYCAGLKEIEIPQSVKDIPAENEGETVYGLGKAAFLGCTKLESVKINAEVKIIPSGAFGSCSSLKEIYIPLSVGEIEGAYYQNGALYYGHAFYNCTALTDIYFAGSVEQWKSIKIDFEQYSFTVNNDAIKSATLHYNFE